MTIAKSRPRALPTPDRATVITNATLLARRITELQRRRQALVTQQEQVRSHLPDWAIEPLRLVGMTNDEIRSLVTNLSTAEAEAGLDQMDKGLDELDRQIEELEGLLVATRSGSFEEIESVLGLVVARLREIFVSDPNDVFYDHGEARVLALVERVQSDLGNLLQRSHLDAG